MSRPCSSRPRRYWHQPARASAESFTLPALVELRLDGRDEELGELGGAVEADPGDLVAHLGVGEALRDDALVVLDVDAGYRGQGRRHLVVVEALHVPRQARVGHDLVDVDVAHERGHVGRRRVAGVEDAQLERLVGPHVGRQQDAGVLVSRSAVGELVLDDPLDERLGHDGPAIGQPVLGEQERRGRQRSCLRGDAIDHAVGEGDVLAGPGLEPGLHHGADAQGGRPRGLAVAHDVVAAEDREAAEAEVASSPQRSGESHEGRRQGIGRRGQEGARGLVHRIAALGDGERDDAGLRPCHPLHERFDVRAGQDVVDDRADDTDVRAPLVPGDQGVEAVLRVQRIRHGRVAGEDARSGDRPVGDALPKEVVEVDGLVSAMEAADTDVDDASTEGAPVVARDDDARVERPEGLRRQVDGASWDALAGHAPHLTPTCTQTNKVPSVWGLLRNDLQTHILPTIMRH